MTIILVPDWTKVKPHRKMRQITRGAPFETLRGWPLKRMGRNGWIDVIGSNGTTLQELNAWYDALVAGDKAAFKA